MLREVHGHPQLYVPQDEECCGHATAIVASGELAALREEVAEEAPDAKKSTESFESAEGSKEVLIDPSSSEGKTVRIGTTLSSE